jgi:hypothetical protein
MRERTDDESTAPIVSSIPKTLHSRESAERLVRAVVGLWREKSDTHNNPSSLILDFDGIFLLSESVANVLVQFRYEFPGGKCPPVKFMNVSAPVGKTLAAAEKSLAQLHKRLNDNRRKKNGFSIKI